MFDYTVQVGKLESEQDSETCMDEVSTFLTFEEALKCFLECIKNPDDDAVLYELGLLNLDDNDELIEEMFDEYEVLLLFKVKGS